jgi:hypothetical protein
MQQSDRLNPPQISVLRTSIQQQTCFRCGKPERVPYTFRLLPGSQYVLVCPTCYQQLWGQKPKRKTTS